ARCRLKSRRHHNDLPVFRFYTVNGRRWHWIAFNPFLCDDSRTMQKRSSIEVARLAAKIVKETEGIELTGKNPAAVALGRRGGLKGGKARAEKLTPEERTAIARRAAVARWGE